MNMEIKMDELIIVTGSSRGIGKEVCQNLEKKGFKTLGIDILESEIKSSSFFYKLDVSNIDEFKALRDYLLKLKCRILGVVNNAAVQVEKSFLEHTPKDLDQVLGVNLKSIYFLMQSVDDLLLAGSSVVNISSVHARSTSKNISAYAASKGAVSALTRAMAIEYGERGVRVNAVLPGAIDTPMLHQGLARNGNVQEALMHLASSSPLNKIGTPDDVAKIVSFLIDSKLSGNITGQEFVCDSGVLCRLASE